MEIISKLKKKWSGAEHPFLIHEKGNLYFSDLTKFKSADLSSINSGDVVALIGDFEPVSILNLLSLIEKKTIIVPLTIETKSQHQYFFQSSLVNKVIEGKKVFTINHQNKNPLIETLRKKKHSGLVLFSTGTTGRPKAILHDLSIFLKRFETPRPTLRTINFLLFDHIGGLNTLMHTLYNRGTVVATNSRKVDDILSICKRYNVEVLPTTPTFLRMMLMSDLIPKKMPNCLKIITYGTERMDQPTLNELCRLLPNIDFRQTFGMSELGILRVKSEQKDSLFMRIGGDGVQTRVVNRVLEIKSKTRMLGYLNAPNPFDEEGWYNTKDIVEEIDGFYKIIGRTSEIINVGGLKFMASEVERVALEYNGVELVKAEGKPNPITGQHVELKIKLKNNLEIDKHNLKKFLKDKLPNYMRPKRIIFSNIDVGHRMKKV